MPSRDNQTMIAVLYAILEMVLLLKEMLMRLSTLLLLSNVQLFCSGEDIFIGFEAVVIVIRIYNLKFIGVTFLNYKKFQEI